jgi:hypothetical protein
MPSSYDSTPFHQCFLPTASHALRNCGVRLKLAIPLPIRPPTYILLLGTASLKAGNRRKRMVTRQHHTKAEEPTSRAKQFETQ